MSDTSKQTGVRYEVNTQEDTETGDMIIPLPIPLLKDLGWKEGDIFRLVTNENGTKFFQKVDTLEKFTRGYE